MSRLTGSLVIVFGAGALATLVSATPAAAAGNVTPSIYVANYGGNDNLTFPLTAGGDVAPTVTNSSSGLGNPSGEAFDGSGDLWVANFHGGTGSVTEFTPSQLASSGSPTPAVTISGGSVAAANAVAFDGSGDMWVTGFGGAVVEFTPGQLTASGSPTPAVSVSTPAGGGWGLSFDSAGDLWTASYFNGNTVFEFTPSQLTTSGSPTPAVTLSGSGLDAPTFPTFDTHGDLWLANSGANPGSVIEFTPAQLTSSGSPTPNVTITSAELDGADGLAFDGSGNLWATGFASSAIVEYTPSQLATSGSPTPTTISGGSTGLNAPGGVAIAEAPSVTALSPSSGPGIGGTKVTITGVGFLPTSTVHFGSTPATSVTYVSPGTLTALAPPGIGRVDVTVSTTFGTSATTPADHFSYQGYLEVASDGGIFAFNAPFYGSMGGKPLNMPIVGMAADPSTGGYWEVASDGGIFNFNAPFSGSMGGKPLNAPMVGIASTPDGGGYWEVANDGGIFSYGDAGFSGSMGGKPLNAPIVGIGADPNSGGYLEVASDGGIFAFNSPFFGSMGGKPLNKPIVGIAG